MTFVLKKDAARNLLSSSGFHNWERLYKKMRSDEKGALRYVNETKFGFLLKNLGAENITYEAPGLPDWSCTLKGRRLAFDVFTDEADGHTQTRLRIFESLDRSLKMENATQVSYIGPSLEQMPQAIADVEALAASLSGAVRTWLVEKNPSDGMNLCLEVESNRVIACYTNNEEGQFADWRFIKHSLENANNPIHSFSPPDPSMDKLLASVRKKAKEYDHLNRILGVGVHICMVNYFEERELATAFRSIGNNVSFIIVSDDTSRKPYLFYREEGSVLAEEDCSKFFRAIHKF